jgi:ATP-binding cassette subfamily B (MDR/TAP) protein 1
LALACTFITPFIVFFGLSQNNEIDDFAATSRENYENSGGIAEEVLYNFKTVSSFANYKFEIKRFNSKLDEAFNFSIKKIKKISTFFALLYFFNYVGISLGILVAAYLYTNGDQSSIFGHVISPGDINIVINCILLSSLVISEASPNVKAIMESCSSAYHFYKLRDSTIIKESENLKSFQNSSARIVNSEIEFNKVVFSYPSNPQRKILDGISFKLKENSLNAIVGTSGSGKSTIISLIERFYEINAGEIKIGGLDISKMDKIYLRSQIGYVPQEPMLFNKSIKENILIGRENISDEQIHKACEMAHVNEFLSNLPNGLDTLVGVKGSKFSGGQKQRIAIARAILGNPKILILDEATSALDVKSEKEVQFAIDSISKQITTIVIAHRLSTIKNSDNIIVLEAGKIVEIGTNESLNAKQGYYFNLIKHQLYKEDKPHRKPSISSLIMPERKSYGSIRKSTISGKVSVSIRRKLPDTIKEEKPYIKEESTQEEKIDEEKLKKHKKMLIDMVLEQKMLVFLALLSSVLLGICFPTLGLLISFYIDMIVSSDPDKIVKLGWIYLFIFLLFAVVTGLSMYLQR